MPPEIRILGAPFPRYYRSKNGISRFVGANSLFMGKTFYEKCAIIFFEVSNMDQIKIGKFIATLRKEKGMTQEQLGERLGVTNKTVSRWENGNYMPDVEMLSLLSEEFDVTINELIGGERLGTEDFKKVADNNLLTALNDSAFTQKERMAFFKKKWLREHIATIVLCVAAWIGAVLAITLETCDGDIFPLSGAIGELLAVLFYMVLHNRMMAYVEDHTFPTPDKKTEDNEEKKK